MSSGHSGGTVDSETISVQARLDIANHRITELERELDARDTMPCPASTVPMGEPSDGDVMRETLKLVRSIDARQAAFEARESNLEHEVHQLTLRNGELEEEVRRLRTTIECALPTINNALLRLTDLEGQHARNHPVALSVPPPGGAKRHQEPEDTEAKEA